jgi:hypothetical protein
MINDGCLDILHFYDIIISNDDTTDKNLMVHSNTGVNEWKKGAVIYIIVGIWIQLCSIINEWSSAQHESYYIWSNRNGWHRGFG